jgi:hypothetical protein
MRNENLVTINLTGFNREEVELDFDFEPTISEVLNKAGWTLGSSERATVNGEDANASSKIEDGDTILVIGRKEGGLL